MIKVLWFLLMILSLMYSFIVYMVGSGTLSFTIWLGLAAFLGVCLFLSLNGRWAAVPQNVRYILFGLLGALALVVIICQIAILSHFSDKGEKDLDYIIVLGAQMRNNGPSTIYSYRLEKAFEYLEENDETLCITTGGIGNNESVSEGEGGAQYLKDLGIPDQRILVESKSRDTVENIQNALEIISEKGEDMSGIRIGIVTNGFHVFRGVHIARKLTDAKICGIAAYMQPIYIPNNMARETFGIIRDFIKGRL